MFFFSIHQDTANIGDHSRYARGWSVKMYTSVGVLAQACTEYLNSPIVWAYGIRSAANFVYADFVTIDVDSDKVMSLEQAMERYGKYVHFMGTTKSHGILKSNSISERFRVFIALEKRARSAEDYRALCMQEAFQVGGDLQACGPAMHFMPMTRIVSYSEVGKRLPNTIAIKRDTKKRKLERCDATCSVERYIPTYIQDWLDGHVRQGERNITVFKAACGLKKRNFTEDEIIQIVLSSSLPLEPDSEKTVREVKNTVRSAMRRK